MASVLDKVHFPDGVSKGAIKTNNQVRSNQYVHDYYHIAKSILPKGITNGVEIVSDTISDTITGVFTNTPWRRKLTRDRLAHALEFEQINPLVEAAKETIAQVTQGINRVKSIVSMEGSNTRGNRLKREIQENDPLSANNPTYFPSKKNPQLNGKVYRFSTTEDQNCSIQFGDTLVHKGDEISEFRKTLQGKKLRPSIFIINPSVSPYQYIELQTLPRDISFSPKTSWAVLNSLGRNTPLYHYSGSEDTIQFDISWYSNDKENPQEVVTKCKLLESWSKANGYSASPPILQIYAPAPVGMFNTSGEIFGTNYILWSAEYKFVNFAGEGYHKLNRRRRPGLPSNPDFPCSIDNEGEDRSTWGDSKLGNNLLNQLYPTTAIQTLIFKRVSDHNLTHQDIISEALVQGTKGIGYTSDKSSSGYNIPT